MTQNISIINKLVLIFIPSDALISGGDDLNYLTTGQTLKMNLSYSN